LCGFYFNVSRHPIRGVLTAILKNAVFWDDEFSLMAAHTLGNVIVFWGNPSIWVRAVVVYYKAMHNINI
jgi:hypothetical protein